MPFSTIAPASPSRSFLFPHFLLPSIPFRSRRRHNSSDSTTSSTSTTSTDSASSPSAANPYLTGHTSFLRCARCATDLCLTSQIISKGFTGRHGRAYLVSPSPSFPSSTLPPSTLPNTHTHKPVPRHLVTGAHTVSDISCLFCGAVLGWKYVAAEDDAQRYKVGKFILETKKVRVGWYWEGSGEQGGEVDVVGGDVEGGVKNEEVQFDSQDEDECEDLFAGVWSPTLALRRRKGRRFGRVQGREEV
ncbi:MAG: hypothetical protein M1833_005747 [Piccolia ochrophora]|nr:MAG: hypothetical protein M1833_005747 [Piccolia ochrophora]